MSMYTGKLFLTSTGLSSENIARRFQNFFTKPSEQSLAIITTAAEGKENNKYSQIAKKKFASMGFIKIDFVDLETHPKKDFSSYGIIYVCGGDTFKLLKFARAANFKSTIENLLKRNGVYVGVSAGSIIVGPSIQIAAEVEPETNDIDLKDLTGFGITDLIVLPHYSPEIEKEIKAFESRYNVTVERLSDSQAILIESKKTTVIE